MPLDDLFSGFQRGAPNQPGDPAQLPYGAAGTANDIQGASESAPPIGDVTQAPTDQPQVPAQTPSPGEGTSQMFLPTQGNPNFEGHQPQDEWDQILFTPGPEAQDGQDTLPTRNPPQADPSLDEWASYVFEAATLPNASPKVKELARSLGQLMRAG
jgi:hypothetical protein